MIGSVRSVESSNISDELGVIPDSGVGTPAKGGACTSGGIATGGASAGTPVGSVVYTGSKS